MRKVAKQAKNRKTVTERALKVMECANSANNDEMNADGWEFVPLHDIKIQSFFATSAMPITNNSF